MFYRLLTMNKVVYNNNTIIILLELQYIARVYKLICRVFGTSRELIK